MTTDNSTSTSKPKESLSFILICAFVVVSSEARYEQIIDLFFAGSVVCSYLLIGDSVCLCTFFFQKKSSSTTMGPELGWMS